MTMSRHSRKFRKFLIRCSNANLGAPSKAVTATVGSFVGLVAMVAIVSCGQIRNDSAAVPTVTSRLVISLPTITPRPGAILPTAASRSEATVPATISRPEATPTVDNRPRTVEDYARRCTGKRFIDYDTVYEMVDAAREGLERRREVNPPPEIRDYHEALIVATEELIEASKLVRGDRKPSVYMFADLDQRRVSGLIRADEKFNAVLFDLDPDVRRTLQRYGCID